MRNIYKSILAFSFMDGPVTDLLEKVGIDYRDRGLAEFELHHDHDVHAFYRLTSDSSRVIHVQGYPGMSSETEARVWAREMNYFDMKDLRVDPKISIGNEHDAVTRNFPNFEIGVQIPYDPRVLEEMLGENIPELKAS